MKKVISYCRVSTDNQKKEGTINLQVEEIRDYCKKKKMSLVKVFSDDGVSGGLEDRPALVDLFDYLDENEVEAVVIYRLDRLARDLIIQENLIKDFEKRGIKIISTQEADLDSKDPTRILIRQLLGGVAQYEKAIITLRLSGGRMRKARKGKFAGGSVALGYKPKNKDLRVDDKEAELVKRIFKMKRRKRMGLREIARELNKQNIPTARGGQWYAGTIRYMLKNPLYKGEMAYNQVKTKRLDLALTRGI